MLPEVSKYLLTGRSNLLAYYTGTTRDGGLHSKLKCQGTHFLPAKVLVAVLVRLVPGDSPPAPRAGSEADEGGIALVPFGDQLLEVARALLPHIQRGVRLEELVQPIIADPLRLWEDVRVPGREIAHDARFKLPLQGLLQGGGLFTAGWRGGIDTSPL